MIPLVNYNYQYIFYYNPKSACSTFRKLFLSLHRNELEDIEGVTHHNLRHYWPILANRDYSDFLVYTVVRNPFTRVISAYLDKCVEIKFNESIRFKNKNYNRLIHQPIFDFLGRERNFSLGYSFEEFLTYLNENIYDPALDVHFKLQSSPNVRLDFFHRIEDGNEHYYSLVSKIFKDNSTVLNSVKNFFESDNKSKTSNTTFSSEFVEDKELQSLTNSSFDEMKNLYNNKVRLNYEKFYNEETKRLVTLIYNGDLDYYNYSFPY